MQRDKLKILAVGAHPDDVELGCGATMASFEREGHETYVLVLTRGEASGNPTLRENECKRSCSQLSVKKLFFGNLQDTKIADGVETIMVIENVINNVEPDIVFSHSSKDGHQDHRNAGLACLSAARTTKRVLLYESPAALREFCPQVFVDVTSTFQAKLEALKEYGSQTSKVFFKGNSHVDESSKFPVVSNAVEGLARFRGFQAGVSLAEAFEVGKYIMDIPSVFNSSKPLADVCEVTKLTSDNMQHRTLATVGT